MGKKRRSEPEYDLLDDYIQDDEIIDNEFESDLIPPSGSRDNHNHRLGNGEDLANYRLPRDWQDFDYATEDWDSL